MAARTMVNFIYQALIAVGIVTLIGAAAAVALYLHLRGQPNEPNDTTDAGAPGPDAREPAAQDRGEDSSNEHQSR